MGVSQRRHAGAAASATRRTWRVETLNDTVNGELDALPANMHARFEYIRQLIETLGLEWVSAPHVRHLTGRLWEMRCGKARALYVAVKDRRVVVVVRAFVKKTRRTPRREIKLAQRRVGEVSYSEHACRTTQAAVEP